MDERIFAKEVSVTTADQTLTILWGDGHQTVFPLEGLRKVCPCATCAEGHENMGKPIEQAIFKQLPTQTWTITNLEEMGNYAVQISWGDGHNTGIYQWESLRNMCPCDICNPA
ncbi:DUF971 domain-containing protein [candidate division KSB1 bacterium]|nr:DUF971 domain-containing protein [candidate division KSB1 bacterium]